MIQEENQIIEKWKPIIDNHFPTASKKMANMLCHYAHNHSLNESFSASVETTPLNISGSGTGSVTLLPLCLKALSRVSNIDEVDVVFESSQIKINTYQISFEISHDEIMALSTLGSFDIVDFMDDIISNEVSLFLEAAIKKEADSRIGRTVLHLKNLVSGVMVLAESTMKPKIVIKLEFGIKSFE